MEVSKTTLGTSHNIFNGKLRPRNKAKILLWGIKGNGFFLQCLLYHRGAAHTFPNSPTNSWEMNFLKHMSSIRAEGGREKGGKREGKGEKGAGGSTD